MKKYFITVLVFLATTAAFAQKKQSKKSPTPSNSQDSTTSNKTALAPLATQTQAPPPAKTKKDWSKVNLTKRSADHFMFQLGYDNWAGTPDSIHIKGANHSVNFYFMFDFPFKTDPRLSIGAGLGIGSSNVYFDHQEVMVAAYQNSTLAFPDESGTNHYKNYKLTTVALEAPVELRFAVDPEHMDQSWKFAVGVKIGLLLSAYTKGKTLESSTGQTLGNYVVKYSSKEFFNTTKLAATARVSKGVVGLFGQIQANSLIKASAGPSVFPFTMGITLSGL